MPIVAFSSVWHIKRLIVFGDGDSDNGNSYAATQIPASPPYWKGRASNGPVWTEYFANILNLIPNPEKNPDYNKHGNFITYSYFGATARGFVGKMSRGVTIADEVAEYVKQSHPYPENTLAVIDIGENDINTTECIASPVSCITGVLQAEQDSIKKLYELNIRHFIVLTPASSNNYPYVVRTFTHQQQQQLKLFYNSYAHQFLGLQQAVQTSMPGSEVLIVNAQLKEQQWMSRFNQPVFIPCYWNVTDGQLIYNRQVGPVCAHPNKYYYFDSFFTSAAANKIWARYVYKQVVNNSWSVQKRRHWWQRLF